MLSGNNSNDSTSGLSAAEERKRKRKSRWAGGDHDKTFIPGMPTILPATLSADQQEAYLGENPQYNPHAIFNQTFFYLIRRLYKILHLIFKGIISVDFVLHVLPTKRYLYKMLIL